MGLTYMKKMIALGKNKKIREQRKKPLPLSLMGVHDDQFKGLRIIRRGDIENTLFGKTI